MNDGIKPTYRDILVAALEASPKVKRAVLFGSRAMGNYRPASDIDLAIYGDDLGLRDVIKIQNTIADAPLPIEVDFIIYNTIKSQELLTHICKHGIAWWERQPLALNARES